MLRYQCPHAITVPAIRYQYSDRGGTQQSIFILRDPKLSLRVGVDPIVLLILSCLASLALLPYSESALLLCLTCKTNLTSTASTLQPIKLAIGYDCSCMAGTPHVFQARVTTRSQRNLESIVRHLAIRTSVVLCFTSCDVSTASILVAFAGSGLPCPVVSVSFLSRNQVCST